MKKFVLFLTVSILLVMGVQAQPQPQPQPKSQTQLPPPVSLTPMLNFQQTIDYFEAPFTVGWDAQAEAIRFIPKSKLDPTKEAAYLQTIYQAWTYYLSEAKITIAKSGVRFLYVDTIGIASTDDLILYSSKKNTAALSSLFIKNPPLK
jgi:hypothetical protein